MRQSGGGNRLSGLLRFRKNKDPDVASIAEKVMEQDAEISIDDLPPPPSAGDVTLQNSVSQGGIPPPPPVPNLSSPHQSSMKSPTPMSPPSPSQLSLQLEQQYQYQEYQQQPQNQLTPTLGQRPSSMLGPSPASKSIIPPVMPTSLSPLSASAYSQSSSLIQSPTISAATSSMSNSGAPQMQVMHAALSALFSRQNESSAFPAPLSASVTLPPPPPLPVADNMASPPLPPPPTGFINPLSLAPIQPSALSLTPERCSAALATQAAHATASNRSDAFLHNNASSLPVDDYFPPPLLLDTMPAPETVDLDFALPPPPPPALLQTGLESNLCLPPPPPPPPPALDGLFASIYIYVLKLRCCAQMNIIIYAPFSSVLMHCVHFVDLPKQYVALYDFQPSDSEDLAIKRVCIHSCM